MMVRAVHDEGLGTTRTRGDESGPKRSVAGARDAPASGLNGSTRGGGLLGAARRVRVAPTLLHCMSTGSVDQIVRRSVADG